MRFIFAAPALRCGGFFILLKARDGFFVEKALAFADDEPLNWETAFVGCYESFGVGVDESWKLRVSVTDSLGCRRTLDGVADGSGRAE